MTTKIDEKYWDVVLTEKQQFFNVNFKAIWEYRDLIFLFVKRDITSLYKQTLLGPLWFFIQPIFTTIVFTFIFGNLAGISTEGTPQPLFYLAGITIWNYFADCLTKTSTVLRDNSNIFGKVYFPRIIMPLSIVISNLFKFFIQFTLFIILFFYYYFFKNFQYHLNFNIFLIPFLVLLVAILGLGFGMIITSVTTKYRDLVILLNFGIQLLMYATAVAYPLSSLSGKMYSIVRLNPLTCIIEAFRKCTLDKGHLSLYSLLYSILFSIVILILGFIVFNKAEKDFIDTV